jgi:hypothetical protein
MMMDFPPRRLVMAFMPLATHVKIKALNIAMDF